MNHTIRCYTLFDITKTNILNRSKPPEDAQSDWMYKRNTQCNFDTLQQIISLRSQPELLSSPVKEFIDFKEFENFGFLFESEEKIPCWKFTFQVQHASVFDDGIHELGHLYRDADQVPMIKCGTEWIKLHPHLDTSDPLRNIYFEITNE